MFFFTTKSCPIHYKMRAWYSTGVHSLHFADMIFNYYLCKSRSAPRVQNVMLLSHAVLLVICRNNLPKMRKISIIFCPEPCSGGLQRSFQRRRNEINIAGARRGEAKTKRTVTRSPGFLETGLTAPPHQLGVCGSAVSFPQWPPRIWCILGSFSSSGELSRSPAMQNCV